MIFSRPSNAPPQMNRMFVVSTCTKSWLGCFAPPCGGTDAMVLRSASTRPAARLLPTRPRYRRVVGLPGNLVDLVDVDDAALRLVHIVIAVLQQLLDDVLDILPT